MQLVNVIVMAAASYHEVSSIRIQTPGVSCVVFRNRLCLPPVVYPGIRASIPDLHDLGIADEIGSIFCGSNGAGSNGAGND
ncbi:hypothetical protein PWT90_03614 [Aphanocladium album]|nr:hypothetical protein PWT90_03614 [Aphanocladium album]